ncbi:MAG: N-succinylarginine dihydrolase [Planctomycetota bacterium]
MTALEINMDRLIGPSHHFGGLSSGNLASTRYRHQASSPKRAAIQGLDKMMRLVELGIPQIVLPPQQRPSTRFLVEQGFHGDETVLLQEAFENAPETLSLAYSASAMWVANAATVSPSADTADDRVHFTPANLYSMPHRRLEARETTETLRAIFHDEKHFVVHDPLPPQHEFADEGAANQTRLCRDFGAPGIEVFVYGRDGAEVADGGFPARQARESFEQIAAQHQLGSDRCVFIKQHPAAIAAGAFHNDVVAVGNQNVHLMHEHAFQHRPEAVERLADAFGHDLFSIEIKDTELSLAEAVRSYLFNSQLLSLEGGEMLLLCPQECESSSSVRAVIDRVLAEDNPVQRCDFLDLTESMRNGGGPACLRLRVVLTAEQREVIPSSVWLTDELYQELRQYVAANYRDELAPQDLADPSLADECRSIAADVANLLLP